MPHVQEADLFSSSVIDIPRPFIDPVESIAQALAIASLVARRPRADVTFALLLDDARRGLGIVAVPPLTERSVHTLVGACCDVPDATSVVVVSLRSGPAVQPVDIALHGRLGLALGAAGFSLLDWVVGGRGGVYCPRVVIGAPDPWPTSVPFR